jgi:hypothetical protein
LKVRLGFFLLALIGFSHAEDVTHAISLGVADDDHSTVQKTKTGDAPFAVVFPCIYKMGRWTFEYFDGSLKINFTVVESLRPLLRIL